MKQISKEAGVVRGGTPTPEQLALIHQQARTELAAEDVYVFSLRLCDDRPDRDDEQFAAEALPRLAELMVGKTGLCDHNWSASEQVARIFDACVEQEDGAHFIRAWAYLLRAHHEQLIDEIEGGIRREVSIGCAMGRRICSVCGAEYGSCQHQKGQVYDGQKCVAILSEPMDAYEFSFVAVPAQPAAGVLKHWQSLENMAQAAGGEVLASYERLRREAEAGQRAGERMRGELVQLGMAMELGLERPLLERMAAAMTPADVEAVCCVWRKTMRSLYPEQTQLSAAVQYGGDEAFVI